MIPRVATDGHCSAYVDAVRLSILFDTAGQRLLAGVVESGSRGAYLTSLNRFRDFLLAASTLLKISQPKCTTAKELRLLIERKGVLEGFICFCSSKGLASKSISGYMDGLKHFASDFEDVPHIAGAAVIARMLVGQVKLGKRPNPRKIGITVDLLREMVVEVECMDELRPVGKALLKAIFVIA